MACKVEASLLARASDRGSARQLLEQERWVRGQTIQDQSLHLATSIPRQ